MRSGAHCLYLASFYEQQRKPTLMDPKDFSFFLDSGAYSAWSRNSQIDLDEYCAFIKANIDHLEVYANLDVIAGTPGKHASKAERNEGARRSWENFLYMRSEGLDPLPVFHAGEDWSWLDNMLAYGCKYIGLGGLVGLDTKLRRSWLDEVFARLCDSEGVPCVKTHGFGMTAIPLIFRYPWHSVDSTTWIQVAANGGVYLPEIRDGVFMFDRIPSIIPVSNNNPKQQKGKGSYSLSPAGLDILKRWLAECGKTYEEVHTHYYHRAVVNVIFFKKVSEAKLNQRFKLERPRRQSLIL